MALLVYRYQGELHNFDIPLEKGILTCLKVSQDHKWVWFSGEDHQDFPIRLLRAESGFYVLIMHGQSRVKVNEMGFSACTSFVTVTIFN